MSQQSNPGALVWPALRVGARTSISWDSFSTDRTLEIAARYTHHIHQHALEGHTQQRTWALRNLPFKCEWVIALDADHRVTPELRDELIRVFASPPQNIDGFYVKRRQIFRGRWIRFGGYYPKYMLKVFRHHSAYLDDNEFTIAFTSGVGARI